MLLLINIYIVPEDIVLGPPKTAFSSASGARNGNKAFDRGHRPSFGHNGDDIASGDRYNLKERLGRTGHKPERDGEKPRDIKLGNSQNRRTTQEDTEHWSSSRQPKGFGHEDTERGHRKTGDRDQDGEKENARDVRAQRGFENHRRQAEREGGSENVTRQNGPTRERFEASWYGEEGNGETTKPRDWRVKEKGRARGGEREWGKANKTEQDPEWMDEPEPEEKKQAHTQEDFERWKEKMRANNGPSHDPIQSPGEHKPSHERTFSNTSTTRSKGKAETPLVIDSNFDGFFGLWSESDRSGWRQGDEENHERNINTIATPKPSKFTGFFSPKPIAELRDIAPSGPALPQESPKNSSNEDKEGFQRILKLLDQQQLGSARNGIPIRETVMKNRPRSPPMIVSRTQETGGLESLLGSQLPSNGAAPQNRDSEFLLKLMQKTHKTQPTLSHGIPADKKHGIGPAPGLLPFPGLIASPRDISQAGAGGGASLGLPIDAFREEQHRDKLNPNAKADRKGLAPGFYDGHAPGSAQTNNAAGPPQHPLMPVGLQRPPGLDQMGTAYGQNIHPQRQNTIQPPPGFQTPLRNHNAFPPGLIPNVASLTSPPERGVQYGMRPVGHNPAAGMPPPGLMGINSLTPGFPMSPFNLDGNMSQPARQYYGGGLQRPGIDGFSETAGFGIGGQGILPGQYRRPEQ